MSIIYNSISYIKKNVNLNAYSKSKKFIGYYESLSKTYDMTDIENAIKLFKKFSPRLVIVAKLDIFDGLSQKLKRKYYLQYANILCDKFVTQEYNLNINSEREKVREMLVGVFDGILFGHIFFYFEEKAMIVYPHDDIGLGFIGERKNNNIIKNQLKNMHSISKFWK